jgi:hypothetical protein
MAKGINVRMLSIQATHLRAKAKEGFYNFINNIQSISESDFLVETIVDRVS